MASIWTSPGERPWITDCFTWTQMGSKKPFSESELITLWARLRDANQRVSGGGSLLDGRPSAQGVARDVLREAAHLAVGLRALLKRLNAEALAVGGLAPEPGKPRVLLVDDDEVALRALHDLLNDEFEIVVAYDSRDAVELIRRGNLDAIVTDLRMPGMDGIALLRWMREDETLASVPFIFISAAADAADRIRAERLSADFLSKPLDPDELAARIHAATRGRVIRRRGPVRSVGETAL